MPLELNSAPPIVTLFQFCALDKQYYKISTKTINNHTNIRTNKTTLQYNKNRQ